MNRSSRFHCPTLNSDDPSQTNWTSLPRPQSQVSMLLTSFLQADRQAPWAHYKIRSRLAVKGTVASCIHFGWRFSPRTLSPSIPTLLLWLCVLPLASAILWHPPSKHHSFWNWGSARSRQSWVFAHPFLNSKCKYTYTTLYLPKCQGRPDNKGVFKLITKETTDLLTFSHVHP